jgi:hypothetical protein
VDRALRARLSPAHVADNQIAPLLIEQLPEEARFVLGDTHYNAENVGDKCERTERFLVTSKRGAYPHTDCVGWRLGGSSTNCVAWPMSTSMSTSRASSRYMSRFPPRAGSTPPASLLGQCWFTSWLYSTVMSETRNSIVDSNRFSELLDEL